jgi:cell division protein FtsB
MKVLALLLLGLVLALQYRLWMADGGMREVWHLRQEVASQTAENTKLNERNRTLAAEVQDLKKGKSAIEERARTDLGMVGANETFFQVAERPSAADNAKPGDTPQGGEQLRAPVQATRQPIGNGQRSATGATRLAVQANK